jgi:hypothetical protein
VPRPQLAINCPAPLLERLRAAATERGTTVTSLVLAWVEAGLDADLDAPRSGLDPSRSTSRPDLDQRLDAVERRLDAIDAPAPAKPASPNRVSLPAQPGEPLPERRLTAAEAAGLLTTPDVGTALGLGSHSALTNWIAREAKKNGSAVGCIYRGHRLRGMGLLPGGQRPGWLWEVVAQPLVDN